MTDNPQDPTANVHSALAAVMGDLPGIGKDGHASQSQGGYAYRGIEAITREAAPLLAKHGVVFVPQVVSMEIRDITVANKPWTDTILTVRYRICGPGGTDDCVEAVVVGIGRDNSDKGANKAMTQAFKYALLQVLCVADGKDDGDGTTAEADAAEDRPPEGFASHEEKSERYGVIRERLASLAPDERDTYNAWKDDHAFTFPYTLAMCVAMEGKLDGIEASRVEEPPDTPPDIAPEQPQVPLPDPGALDAATEAVATLTPGEVEAELLLAQLPATGSIKDKRARLAVHRAVGGAQ